MATGLHLQVVNRLEAGWLDTAATATRQSQGWDAQLLQKPTEDRGPDRPAPSIFLGELPEVAASDSRSTAPQLVVAVATVLGDGVRTIDEALIEQVLLAFEASDTPSGGAASPVDVWRFLRAHQGRRVQLVRQASPDRQAEPEAVSVAAPPGASNDASRWGAAADWLTLATLRAVVIGIVALHLFVLVGEALLAAP